MFNNVADVHLFLFAHPLAFPHLLPIKHVRFFFSLKIADYIFKSAMHVLYLLEELISEICVFKIFLILTPNLL